MERKSAQSNALCALALHWRILLVELDALFPPTPLLALEDDQSTAQMVEPTIYFLFRQLKQLSGATVL
jgi:hypothetical protein